MKTWINPLPSRLDTIRRKSSKQLEDKRSNQSKTLPSWLEWFLSRSASSGSNRQVSRWRDTQEDNCHWYFLWVGSPTLSSRRSGTQLPDPQTTETAQAFPQGLHGVFRARPQLGRWTQRDQIFPHRHSQHPVQGFCRSQCFDRPESRLAGRRQDAVPLPHLGCRGRQ